MLNTCLNNKIIREFLSNYNESRWQKLIPSLIEIAILNLNSSFHTVIFSEEDIDNILNELKINQNSNKIQTKKPKRESHSHVIFSKPSNQWRTADGGVPPISGNKEKEFSFDNSTLTNNSKYNKENRELARENMKNKKIIKNTRSKIKEQVDIDKLNYYKKMNINNPNYIKNNNKPIEKINYAISYDKNLEPELIEKTTINRNKKGGKKIVEKMTHEEYEQKFPDEEKNLENEYEEEDDDDNEEQNQEENEEYEEYYEAENQNQNLNNMQYNNTNKDRKNLYHYKTDNNNDNKNNIMLNKQNQNSNSGMYQNPQQSFNSKSFRNNAIQNINQQKNNYINIENNANEPQNNNNNEYNYNPHRSEEFNNNYNNYKVGVSESDDKSSKFIGIEQKYQKRIDELEKNIINAGVNNTDNYGDKLKVNITNMEDYNKYNENKNYQNYQYNNANEIEEEENENEDNNLNEDNNEVDNGVLSQMSNMSERTKSLFKRTMDEYPPIEEDTFFEQSQKE